MFISAVPRYLIWASLAAVVLAVVLSFVLMRKVLAPDPHDCDQPEDATGDFRRPGAKRHRGRGGPAGPGLQPDRRGGPGEELKTCAATSR